MKKNGIYFNILEQFMHRTNLLKTIFLLLFFFFFLFCTIFLEREVHKVGGSTTIVFEDSKCGFSLIGHTIFLSYLEGKIRHYNG